MLNENLDEILDDLCNILKTSYERSWISTRDGNASYRNASDNLLHITPSGVRKQTLKKHMIIDMEFDSDNSDMKEPWKSLSQVSSHTKLKPSGEIFLHSFLQRVVPKNRVVLHLHPTYTVAALHAGINLQKLSKAFPEINRYTRVGPSVKALPPISQDLAAETIKSLELNKLTGEVAYDIVGLDKHGTISLGENPYEALEHVERLEHICKVVLASNNYQDLLD